MEEIIRSSEPQSRPQRTVVNYYKFPRFVKHLLEGGVAGDIKKVSALRENARKYLFIANRLGYYSGESKADIDIKEKKRKKTQFDFETNYKRSDLFGLDEEKYSEDITDLINYLQTAGVVERNDLYYDRFSFLQKEEGVVSEKKIEKKSRGTGDSELEFIILSKNNVTTEKTDDIIFNVRGLVLEGLSKIDTKTLEKYAVEKFFENTGGKENRPVKPSRVQKIIRLPLREGQLIRDFVTLDTGFITKGSESSGSLLLTGNEEFKKFNLLLDAPAWEKKIEILKSKELFNYITLVSSSLWAPFSLDTLLDYFNLINIFEEDMKKKIPTPKTEPFTIPLFFKQYFSNVKLKEAYIERGVDDNNNNNRNVETLAGDYSIVPFTKNPIQNGVPLKFDRGTLYWNFINNKRFTLGATPKRPLWKIFHDITEYDLKEYLTSVSEVSGEEPPNSEEISRYINDTRAVLRLLIKFVIAVNDGLERKPKHDELISFYTRHINELKAYVSVLSNPAAMKMSWIIQIMLLIQDILYDPGEKKPVSYFYPHDLKIRKEEIDNLKKELNLDAERDDLDEDDDDDEEGEEEEGKKTLKQEEITVYNIEKEGVEEEEEKEQLHQIIENHIKDRITSNSYVKYRLKEIREKNPNLDEEKLKEREQILISHFRDVFERSPELFSEVISKQSNSSNSEFFNYLLAEYFKTSLEHDVPVTLESEAVEESLSKKDNSVMETKWSIFSVSIYDFQTEINELKKIKNMIKDTSEDKDLNDTLTLLDYHHEKNSRIIFGPYYELIYQLMKNNRPVPLYEDPNRNIPKLIELQSNEFELANSCVVFFYEQAQRMNYYDPDSQIFTEFNEFNNSNRDFMFQDSRHFLVFSSSFLNMIKIIRHGIDNNLFTRSLETSIRRSFNSIDITQLKKKLKFIDTYGQKLYTEILSLFTKTRGKVSEYDEKKTPRARVNDILALSNYRPDEISIENIETQLQEKRGLAKGTKQLKKEGFTEEEITTQKSIQKEAVERAFVQSFFPEFDRSSTEENVTDFVKLQKKKKEFMEVFYNVHIWIDEDVNERIEFKKLGDISKYINPLQFPFQIAIQNLNYNVITCLDNFYTRKIERLNKQINTWKTDLINLSDPQTIQIVENNIRVTTAELEEITQQINRFNNAFLQVIINEYGTLQKDISAVNELKTKIIAEYFNFIKISKLLGNYGYSQWNERFLDITETNEINFGLFSTSQDFNEEKKSNKNYYESRKKVILQMLYIKLTHRIKIINDFKDAIKKVEKQITENTDKDQRLKILRDSNIPGIYYYVFNFGLEPRGDKQSIVGEDEWKKKYKEELNFFIRKNEFRNEQFINQIGNPLYENFLSQFFSTQTFFYVSGTNQRGDLENYYDFKLNVKRTEEIVFSNFYKEGTGPGAGKSFKHPYFYEHGLEKIHGMSASTSENFEFNNNYEKIFNLANADAINPFLLEKRDMDRNSFLNLGLEQSIPQSFTETQYPQGEPLNFSFNPSYIKWEILEESDMMKTSSDKSLFNVLKKNKKNVRTLKRIHLAAEADPDSLSRFGKTINQNDTLEQIAQKRSLMQKDWNYFFWKIPTPKPLLDFKKIHNEIVSVKGLKDDNFHKTIAIMIIRSLKEAPYLNQLFFRGVIASWIKNRMDNFPIETLFPESENIKTEIRILESNFRSGKYSDDSPEMERLKELRQFQERKLSTEGTRKLMGILSKKRSFPDYLKPAFINEVINDFMMDPVRRDITEYEKKKFETSFEDETKVDYFNYILNGKPMIKLSFASFIYNQLLFPVFFFIQQKTTTGNYTLVTLEEDILNGKLSLNNLSYPKTQPDSKSIISPETIKNLGLPTILFEKEVILSQKFQERNDSAIKKLRDLIKNFETSVAHLNNANSVYALRLLNIAFKLKPEYLQYYSHEYQNQNDASKQMRDLENLVSNFDLEESTTKRRDLLLPRDPDLSAPRREFREGQGLQVHQAKRIKPRGKGEKKQVNVQDMRKELDELEEKISGIENLEGYPHGDLVYDRRTEQQMKKELDNMKDELKNVKDEDEESELKKRIEIYELYFEHSELTRKAKKLEKEIKTTEKKNIRSTRKKFKTEGKGKEEIDPEIDPELELEDWIFLKRQRLESTRTTKKAKIEREKRSDQSPSPPPSPESQPFGSHLDLDKDPFSLHDTLLSISNGLVISNNFLTKKQELFKISGIIFDDKLSSSSSSSRGLPQEGFMIDTYSMGLITVIPFKDNLLRFVLPLPELPKELVNGVPREWLFDFSNSIIVEDTEKPHTQLFIYSNRNISFKEPISVDLVSYNVYPDEDKQIQLMTDWKPLSGSLRSIIREFKIHENFDDFYSHAKKILDSNDENWWKVFYLLLENASRRYDFNV